MIYNFSEMDDILNDENFQTLDKRRNTTKIHEAIREDSLEKLESALRQDVSDLNQKNHRGETPLMYSLKKLGEDTMILRLLDAGCDVNIPNKRNQNSLHLAVCRHSTEIPLELIKRGLDIDAQDCYGLTPLHYAVYNNNEDSVALLLYYGADVNIVENSGSTPFMIMRRGRITQYNIEIAEILFDYYDNFSQTLTLADYAGGLLANKMPYKKFADVFVKFWEKMDHNIIDCSLYLWQCILNRSFSTIDWLRCVYLILEYSIADNYVGHICHRLILTSLLCSFYARRISKFHRVSILWACLSLGINVSADEFCLTHQLFGFNDELEALIYFVDIKGKDHCQNYPVSTFILGLEQNYRIEYLHHLFSNLLEEQRFEQRETEYTYGISFFRLISSTDVCNIFKKYINDSLKYFSFYVTSKQQFWLPNSNEKSMEIWNKISKVPKVSSLVEICRNQARINIVQTHKIQFPYEFHQVVENLCVPREIKEIIRFKRPIY